MGNRIHRTLPVHLNHRIPVLCRKHHYFWSVGWSGAGSLVGSQAGFRRKRHVYHRLVCEDESVDRNWRQSGRREAKRSDQTRNQMEHTSRSIFSCGFRQRICCFLLNFDASWYEKPVAQERSGFVSLNLRMLKRESPVNRISDGIL